MDELLWRLLLLGIPLAVISGMLGSVIIWQRLAYLGECVAHAAVLGIAIGVLLQWRGPLAVLVLCALVGVLLSGRARVGMDAQLGVIAHGALALGLIVFHLLTVPSSRMMAFLTGDLLLISTTDLVLLYLLALMATICLWWLWRGILLTTLDTSLAYAYGARPQWLLRLLGILLAAAIATMVYSLGALLVLAVMIIPAATASLLARTPEGMVAIAATLCLVAYGIGVTTSFVWDVPTAPMVVATAALLFFIARLRRQH